MDHVKVSGPQLWVVVLLWYVVVLFVCLGFRAPGGKKAMQEAVGRIGRREGGKE